MSQLVLGGLAFGILLTLISSVATIANIGKPGVKIDGPMAAASFVLGMPVLAAVVAAWPIVSPNAAAQAAFGWLVVNYAFMMGETITKVGQVYPSRPRTPRRALTTVIVNMVTLVMLAVLMVAVA